MPDDLSNKAGAAGTSASAPSLVADILRDAQELIGQQLAMFKSEMKEDMARTKQALYPMAIRLGVGAVALIHLSLMLVYLIHWAAGGDPHLPLWGAFGIVGAILALAGVGLYFAGQQRLQSFNPLPDKAAGALKENLQWLSNPQK